jgi:hypothetical protein
MARSISKQSPRQDCRQSRCPPLQPDGTSVFRARVFGSRPAAACSCWHLQLRGTPRGLVSTRAMCVRMRANRLFRSHLHRLLGRRTRPGCPKQCPGWGKFRAGSTLPARAAEFSGRHGSGRSRCAGMDGEQRRTFASLASRGFGLVASFAAQAQELRPAPGFVVEVERVRSSHARCRVSHSQMHSQPSLLTISHLQILFNWFQHHHIYFFVTAPEVLVRGSEGGRGWGPVARNCLQLVEWPAYRSRSGARSGPRPPPQVGLALCTGAPGVQGILVPVFPPDAHTGITKEERGDFLHD